MEEGGGLHTADVERTKHNSSAAGRSDANGQGNDLKFKMKKDT